MANPEPGRQGAGDGRRFLDPLAALRAAIDRLRAELPARGEAIDPGRCERLDMAATDVLRAVVGAQRVARDLEREGFQAIDQAAGVLGAGWLERLGARRRREAR
jgi:hypothetical protein